MARSDLSIIISARDLASKQFKGLDAQLDRTGARLKSLSSGLNQMGNVLTMAVTAPLAAAGVAAIKLATDMVESENLFKVAMGDMAGAAREWSEALRNQLGLNAVELRKSVGTFNVMFTAMGLGKQAAFDMSTGLVKLSQDMASFFNISSEEAFTKLRAGIVGETEPLRELGIVILETTVNQWALTNGLIKQGEKLSESQKILARYGLIMESTSKAQGDLARTIESPANQLRIFQARLQEVGQTVGTEFLPAVSGALLWINNVGFPVVMESIDAFKHSWADMSDEARTRVLFVAGLLVTGGPLLKGLSVAISGVKLFARSWILMPLAAVVAGALIAQELGKITKQLGHLLDDWLEAFAKVASVVGATDLAQSLRDAGRAAQLWADGFKEATSFTTSMDLALGLLDKAFNRVLGAAEEFTKDGLEALVDKVQTTTDATRRLRGDIDPLSKSMEVLAAPIGTVKAAWDSAAGAMGEAKQKADELGVSAGQLVSALVAMHPATIAAAAAVKTWQSRISDVTLALRANQDQLRAAQAELSSMQARLGELNSALSTAKTRLDNLKAPRLVGMGELDTQIQALEALQKRVSLAEMKGVPLASILKSLPLSPEMVKTLTKLGAIGGNLYGPIVLSAEAIAKMIETLKLTGDIKFGEQLTEIAKAAGETEKELTFDEAIKAIVKTKVEIAELTSAVSTQEAAIQSQIGWIANLQAAQDSLNATLETYRAHLEVAERNLGLVTDALKLAFDWLVSDRTKMIEMGGTAAEQALLIDAATRQLLTDIDEFASGVATSAETDLGTVIAAYQTAVDAALAQLARIPPEITVKIKTVRTSDSENDVEGRQHGGPVHAGQTYLVGERGPELFRANQSGAILPLGGGGGMPVGGTVQVNLTVQGSVMTEQDLVETVRRELIRLGRRNVNALGGLA